MRSSPVLHHTLIVTCFSFFFKLVYSGLLYSLSYAPWHLFLRVLWTPCPGHVGFSCLHIIETSTLPWWSWIDFSLRRLLVIMPILFNQSPYSIPISISRHDVVINKKNFVSSSKMDVCNLLLELFRCRSSSFSGSNFKLASSLSISSFDFLLQSLIFVLEDCFDCIIFKTPKILSSLSPIWFS